MNHMNHTGGWMNGWMGGGGWIIAVICVTVIVFLIALIGKRYKK